MGIHKWLVALGLLQCLAQVQCYEPTLRPRVSAAEIIEARGFSLRKLYLTSQDGYRLQLIHAWHPKFENATDKVPILFVHGLMAQANAFVINSFDVRPRDLSAFDLSNGSQVDIILRDPSSKSLPFLAMNFGHHVWLINRRGSPASQEKVSRHRVEIKQQEQSSYWDELGALIWPTTLSGVLAERCQILRAIPFSFDPDFWDYSIDEQAEYDFPQTINLISSQSGGSKVAVVGHSEGGAITLMALSEKPELAEKISSAILWAPAFSLSAENGGIVRNLAPLEPFLVSYWGSIPPAFSVTQIEASVGLLCSTQSSRRTVCRILGNSLFGDGGDKEPLLPNFVNSLFYASSSHEVGQFAQVGNKFGGIMHKFDYGSNKANEHKYGSPKPPAYNASMIQLKQISFYIGLTDTQVTTNDVRNSANQLRSSSYRFHLLNSTFNHVGFFFHDDTARLAILPSLQEIQDYALVFAD